MQTILEAAANVLAFIFIYGVMLYGIYTIPLAIILSIVGILKRWWWITGICAAFLALAFIEAEYFVRAMNS